MEKTELEAICQEILALEGVTLAMFYDKDGKTICMKYNVKLKNWVMPKEEVEKRAITFGQLICEIADAMSKHVGRLRAFALFHEKRNSFLFPMNGLFLAIVGTKKILGVSVIEKIEKIVKKHTR